MVGASLLLIPQLLFSPPASPPRHALHAATLLRRAEPPLELPAALARERGAAQALPYLLRRRGAPLRMQAVAPPPTRAASPSGTSSGAPGTGRTRDAAVSDDAMRWYLSSIGSRRLLDNEEEVQLAVAVKQLLAWLRTRTELVDTLGRRPTHAEWAAAVGFGEASRGVATPESVDKFEQQLRLFEMAKDRMITSNLRLVVSIAKKYANRGVNIQDLIQEGSFGLMTAVDKFDPQHNCRFSTYAHYWIKQAVTRALADYSRAIRLPVHMNDCVNSIRRLRTTFYLAHGRYPSEEELASSLHISESKLRLALSSSRELVSLEAPCFTNKRSADDKAWLDMIPDEAPKPESTLDESLLQEQIHDTLLAALQPLEREILCMRYGLEGRDKRTFEQIGTVFQLPKERVRQIESRALRKLRRPQQKMSLQAFYAQRPMGERRDGRAY